jgi:MoaA/NifB/PqqE/SkfB family radical SAM enzyme
MKAVLRDFAILGTVGIGFTGGEPLLRKDIFELLRYTKELGMIAHLNTNGFFLDDDNIEKLLEAQVDSLNISLDGASSKTHDALRGFAGAFDKVVAAVKKINLLRQKRNNPIRLKLVAVINDRNIDEVPAFIRLAAGLEADCVEFIPQQPFSSTSTPQELSRNRIFMDKLSKLTAYLLKLKGGALRIENSPRHLKMFTRSFKGLRPPLHCYAGYNSYTVDCYGEIYPCLPWLNWNLAACNIGNSNLRDIWYSRQYQQIRKDVLRCKGCYLNCQTELNLLFNLGRL